MTEGDELLTVLEESRRLGFLGPGPIEDHLASARCFLAALQRLEPARVLDLGSGGGVPGLPLALWLPQSEFVLLESMDRRATFLASAAERLGMANRVNVVHERAEIAGRLVDLRATFDAVTSRSFGPPGVTAECGSPFLRAAGALLVSEPPDRPERWDSQALQALGMAVVSDPQAGIAVMVQEAPCPDRYPRRTGIPAKRPLF